MKNPATLSLLLILTGCAAVERSSTGVTVRTWGTLREALRDGKTHTRVKIDSLESRDLFAVGAATDLDGEITIVDGACHISRVRGDRVLTLQSSAVEATLLFAAHVRQWQPIEVKQDVPPEKFEAFVTAAARKAGLDTREPFPFQVEGQLLGLQLHVLAGECPIRARILGKRMTTPPVHRSFTRIPGRLVGIHASQGGGVITHHGSTTHVHALLPEQHGLTGHCDAVGLAAGAVIRFPQTGSPR